MIYKMQENFTNYIYIYIYMIQGLGLISGLYEDFSQLNIKKTNYSIIKFKSQIITSVDEDVENSKLSHTLQVGMKNGSTNFEKQLANSSSD